MHLPALAAWSVATVDAPICLTTTTIELPVGNVAAPVEAIRQSIVIGHPGPGRRTVESAVDSVSLPVEAPLDTIATIGSSRRRPVTGRILRQDRPAEQAQRQSRGRNEASLSHVPSPRNPKLTGLNAGARAALTWDRT